MRADRSRDAGRDGFRGKSRIETSRKWSRPTHGHRIRRRSRRRRRKRPHRPRADSRCRVTAQAHSYCKLIDSGMNSITWTFPITRIAFVSIRRRALFRFARLTGTRRPEQLRCRTCPRVRPEPGIEDSARETRCSNGRRATGATCWREAGLRRMDIESSFHRVCAGELSAERPNAAKAASAAKPCVVHAHPFRISAGGS